MKKFCSLILISLVSTSLLAEDFTNPTARVKDSVEKVISVLKDESLERELRWKSIGSVINQSFDFRSMSQSILATNWRTATPAEREKFVEFFSQYLEETYRTKIEAYTNQKVEYIGETINGKRAVVETLIITDKDLTEPEWEFYDSQSKGFEKDFTWATDNKATVNLSRALN